MQDEYIGFNVDKDRKDKWFDEVEESSEYQSLTHLIKLAVMSELSDAPDTGDGAVEFDLSELHERFDAVEDTLAEMEDRIDDTYSILYRDENHTPEIRAKVQELIPTGDREAILGRDPSRHDSPEEAARRTGSVATIAEHLQRESGGRYAPSDVRHAIETLTDDVGSIEATYADPAAERDKRVYRVER